MNIINHVKKFDFISFVRNFLFFIIVAWINNGLVRGIFLLNAYVILFLFVIWFIMAGLTIGFLIDFFKYTFFLVIFIIIITIPHVLVYETISADSINYVFIMIIFSFFIYYIKNKNISLLKFITAFIIFDKTLIAIRTLYVMRTFPDISRILASGSLALSGTNLTPFLLADYSGIYSLVPLIVFIIYIIKWFPITNKPTLLLFSLLMTILVISASYTIAITLMVLFITVSLITKRRFALSILTICIIALILKPVLSNVFINISNLSFISQTLSIRLDQLSQMINGNFSSDSSFSMRVDLYYQSIQSMIRYPLFGIADINGNNLMYGNHTEWIDLLAKYGLLRTIFLFVFLIKSMRILINNCRLKYKYLIILIFIYIIAAGLVNPIMSRELALVIYLLIPFILLLTSKGEQKYAKN